MNVDIFLDTQTPKQIGMTKSTFDLFVGHHGFKVIAVIISVACQYGNVWAALNNNVDCFTAWNIKPIPVYLLKDRGSGVPPPLNTPSIFPVKKRRCF